MKTGLFITGTDTDVGKTIVTAGILRHLRREGIDAVSMKPVQTGAPGTVAPDLEVHLRAAALSPNEDEMKLMAPYCYEPACSPHLAARMAAQYPELTHIEKCAGTLLDNHDALLVEGAGGVYAPLDESNTMLDMMKALAFPVLLVAHRGLGTINHSLLSIHALRDAGLEVLGIVFNETQQVAEDFIRKDNPGAVSQFGGIEVLGNIDFMSDFNESTWKIFESCMPGMETIQKKVVQK